MSEILLFSRLMSSLLSARTFWLSSWTKIPTHISIKRIFKLPFWWKWSSFSHLQSAFELLQLSLHFLDEEQQKHTKHWRFILELTGKLKMKKQEFKNRHHVFRSKVGELCLLQDHHIFPDGVEMSHELLDCNFLTGTNIMHVSTFEFTVRRWKKGSASDIKNAGIASYLVGFGYHVFINNIHVCCGQSDQSWNYQLCLTLRETWPLKIPVSHI